MDWIGFCYGCHTVFSVSFAVSLRPGSGALGARPGRRRRRCIGGGDGGGAVLVERRPALRLGLVPPTLSHPPRRRPRPVRRYAFRLPSFKGTYLVLPSFTGFYLVLLSIFGFFSVLPGLTGFLLGFTGCNEKAALYGVD